MPIYEYKCDGCRKIHEVMQKFSDPLLEKCPECSGPVEKVMSLSGFALKGAGWYTTDYKRSASSGSTAASSGSESSSSEKATSSAGA